MVIRKALILSLVATGTVMLGSDASTMAQGVNARAHSPLQPASADGLILSAEDLPLAEGETIISGPPEIMGLHGPAPLHGHDHGLGPHGPAHGHPPVLDPGVPFGVGEECYAPCDPGYYGIVEALYMMRGDEDGFDPSDSFLMGLDEFDYEWGPRITVGRRFDCVNGYEFVYAGQLEWTEQATFDGPGTINTRLFPITILDDAPVVAPALPDPDTDVPQLDAFFGSTVQSQIFRAEYDSFEFNRTYNGWDVVRASIGGRVVKYDEDYLYLATDGVDDGAIGQSAENLLVGLQLGLDMYYPLGRRLFIGSRLKGGAYLNLAESDGFATENGALYARRSDDDEELAGIFEARSMLGYTLTDCVTATVGYDIWYLAGVASALDTTAIYGQSMDVDEDVFIHGATAGIEVSF